MAFRAVVVVGLIALASAGMIPMNMNMNMNNMMGMMNMGGMMQQSGCNPDTPGGGCQIPQSVDMGEYIQQQMEQQQYETQQMAEKLKAQFEEVMRDVTMKKHRYAMSVMTEFTGMCACAREAVSIYQSMFVENAKALNLTDVVDLNDINMLPYQAKSAKEARELIFTGMLKALCNKLGEYMAFVTQVEANIPVFERVTTPSGLGR